MKGMSVCIEAPCILSLFPWHNTFLRDANGSLVIGGYSKSLDTSVSHDLHVSHGLRKFTYCARRPYAAENL